MNLIEWRKYKNLIEDENEIDLKRGTGMGVGNPVTMRDIPFLCQLSCMGSFDKIFSNVYFVFWLKK